MASGDSMTLEDFFTLTEMNDGLTSKNRVEELMSVMQKDNDSVKENFVEAARQWSTVASTLVATDSRDSLDHFVSLDGLLFLDRWLQDAQKVSNDTCANFVEESISLLLGALKKLPIDNKRSISSGIAETVKNLFVHKSVRVQETAKALLDVWNQGRVIGKDHQDIEEIGRLIGDRVKLSDGTIPAESWRLNSSLDNTHFERNSNGKHIGNEHQHSRNSDCSELKGIRDVNDSVTSNKGNNHTTLDQENKKEGFWENVQGSSFMSNTCQGSSSTTKEASRHSAEWLSSIEICSIQASVEWRSSESPELKTPTNDSQEMNGRNDSSVEIVKKEKSSFSSSSGPESVSSADLANLQQPLMQPDVLYNSDARGTEVCVEKTPSAGPEDDTCTLATESNGLKVESGGLKHVRSGLYVEGTEQLSGSCSDALQNSSIDGYSLRRPDNLETSFSGEQDTETADNVEELTGESVLKLGKGYETNVTISKREIDAKVLEVNKSFDMEFDYGIDDALEVARQVAKDVEREVVGYREQSCSSSSEKHSEDGLEHPGSPDSIYGGREQSVLGPPNEIPVEQNLHCRALSPNGENSENRDETEDCIPKIESAQSTEILQKPDDASKTGLCEFDLNEVCSEDIDHPTITFVSASKVSPSGVPRAPLHFEGQLGWKGSAATSAFRPASARRTPDVKNTLSVEGSSQSSKQRKGFLDFDLNVAEGCGDGAAHPTLEKQVPVSSDLPSGESSVEVSSRRAQRLKLDLNRIGDNEETPSSDCRMEERFRWHHWNGSPSPASSSSSRQFPARNIDLNGNPSFFDDSSDQRLGFSKCSSLNMNTSGGLKLDDPMVSILGARVAINRSEFLPQTRSFLPNARGVESPLNGVFTRSENGLGAHHQMAYAPPPSSLFAYSGFSNGSPVSFSPGVYGSGSVPYMVDSRGSPVVQQMMPSPSDFPPSQPPFLVSTSSPFMGFNGVSRPSFDLNSGVAVVEAESRETGGLRQLFIPGPEMFSEEQTRSASQSLGPGVGMKRKEPDGGWDLYPVGYKHQSPWH